eukprot:6479951-Amphidinium_carterae.1
MTASDDRHRASEQCIPAITLFCVCNRLRAQQAMPINTKAHHEQKHWPHVHHYIKSGFGGSRESSCMGLSSPDGN